MGPSDKLQSNYGRYRRGKCQPRNCVDNWLTDCNKQCGGDRGNSCLILLISGYCLCRHFCFFHSDCHRLQKKQWVRCRQTAPCALHTTYCTHLHTCTLGPPHSCTPQPPPQAKGQTTQYVLGVPATFWNGIIGESDQFQRLFWLHTPIDTAKIPVKSDQNSPLKRTGSLIWETFLKIV